MKSPTDQEKTHELTGANGVEHVDCNDPECRWQGVSPAAPQSGDTSLTTHSAGASTAASAAFSGWTEAAVGTLTALWDAGKSAREIAAALHCPRNAVIGKAHRLGLDKRPSPIRRAPNPNGCRWPMWQHHERPNHVYCGEPRVSGCSYCPAHKAVAFTAYIAPAVGFVPTRAGRMTAYLSK